MLLNDNQTENASTMISLYVITLLAITHIKSRCIVFPTKRNTENND